MSGNGLRRLLGSGEPDITCEQCFEELDRYVELELAGEDADAAVPGMDVHLGGCPACWEDYESLRAFLLSGGTPPAAGRPGR
jgi:hypothetical protein